MHRLIYTLALLAMLYGLYRCAHIRPEDTRFHAILSAEIARLNEEYNPLCAELSGVEGFPHVAPLARHYFDRDEESAEPPPPADPLGLRWRELVAAGLLTESEALDPGLRLEGYRYELTAKGHALYREHRLPTGVVRARFCLGRPVLKQILAIGKPTYSIEGLNVPARYLLKVERARPEFYDGTAQALHLALPPRSPEGELLYPEVRAVFVLQRDTDKVLSWNPQ